jgi:hypothetical protein
VQLRNEAYQAEGIGPKPETAPQANKTAKKQSPPPVKGGKKPSPVVGSTPSPTPSASVSLVQRWFVDHLRRQAHSDLFPSPSPSASPKAKQTTNN